MPRRVQPGAVVPMTSDTSTRWPNSRREIKVKLPGKYLVRLHSMKVLTGKQLGEAVTEALEAYFEKEPVTVPVLTS